MEKLSIEETAKLKSVHNYFSTPIRALFESLEVGESLWITSREWSEFYSANIRASVNNWARNRKWKVSTKTAKKEGDGAGALVTYAVIRTE